jgi:hypothetical protein
MQPSDDDLPPMGYDSTGGGGVGFGELTFLVLIVAPLLLWALTAVGRLAPNGSAAAIVRASDGRAWVLPSAPDVQPGQCRFRDPYSGRLVTVRGSFTVEEGPAPEVATRD